MSESEKVLYEVDKKIATITLNRPEALNAIDLDMLDTLPQMFEEAEHDSKVHALVITATGERSFCAGLDTKMLSEATRGADLVDRILVQGNKMVRALWQAKKPSAVAINGLAMGWGMISSMMVDFRFVADNPSVFFALSELDAGVFPATAGAFGAIINFGVKKAQEMILTARRYSIEEMKALNFITAIIPRSQLLGDTMKFMVKIARRPTHLVYASKAVMNLHAARLFDDAVAMEYEFFNFLREHQDDSSIDEFLKQQWAKFGVLPRGGQPWGSD